MVGRLGSKDIVAFLAAGFWRPFVSSSGVAQVGVATLFDLHVYREIVALFDNDLVADLGTREFLAPAWSLAAFNLVQD